MSPRERNLPAVSVGTRQPVDGRGRVFPLTGPPVPYPSVMKQHLIACRMGPVPVRRDPSPSLTGTGRSPSSCLAPRDPSGTATGPGLRFPSCSHLLAEWAPSRLAKPPFTVLTVMQSTKPTPAFMPRVAAELIDLIISFLHPIPLQSGNGDGNFLDRSTATNVAKCGLVCREWVPSSRRVLFYRVHVRRRNADAFVKLFKKPQHLTFLPYIRELQFHLSGIVKNRWWTTILLRLAKHLSWSVYSGLLSARSGHYPYMLPCRQLPGITHLDIVADRSTPAEIMRCVASFPSLETLKVRIWPWNQSALVVPDEPLQLAKTLHSLDFKCPDVGNFLSWIQSTNVRVSTLKLYIRWDSVEAWAEAWVCAVSYIQDCGSSLTSLSLTFLEYPEISELANDFLRWNTHLRELTIQADAADAAPLLTRIRLPPSLQIITLVIPALTPLSDQVSSDLDSAIASRDSIRQLGIVYFGPYTSEQVELLGSNLDEMSARFLYCLPLCAARGIVTESFAGVERWKDFWW
ncbi:hypothetical protein DFH09DRAFT_253770 [Mycena vulgaris]|nr:hypothetical protein DFH09DRAFT_253770 [Mycena vulgaris]